MPFYEEKIVTRESAGSQERRGTVSFIYLTFLNGECRKLVPGYNRLLIREGWMSEKKVNIAQYVKKWRSPKLNSKEMNNGQVFMFLGGKK